MTFPRVSSPLCVFVCVCERLERTENCFMHLLDMLSPQSTIVVSLLGVGSHGEI